MARVWDVAAWQGFAMAEGGNVAAWHGRAMHGRAMAERETAPSR